MLGDECLVYILENHHIEELAAEMQAGGRSRNRTLIGGEDGLEIHLVLGNRLFLHPFRDWNVAQAEEGLLEILVPAVIEKPQCPSSRGGVVDDFGHETVISEIKLVADADFSGRLHNDVPEPLLPVQFPEKEDLDVGAGLLLLAQKPGRKYLRVIEDERVALSEVIHYILENPVLYFSRVLVQYHHPALVAPFSGRLVSNVILEGDWKLKLR